VNGSLFFCYFESVQLQVQVQVQIMVQWFWRVLIAQHEYPAVLLAGQMRHSLEEIEQAGG